MFCTLSRFALIKKCAFRASSHIGWWLLKSPSHSTCARPLLDSPAQPLHALYCATIHTLSRLVLSLYMLITKIGPICDWICTAVMSDEPNSTCTHESASILLFMSSTNLVFWGAV